ncbi:MULTISPECIES: hypothetical protein [unclassified Streptomyces]|uniref:hypothetical protein n=1 Tax=unclassified Streptomyces TaxID=2593676 RepID=UPI002E27E16E|nr:hypothetical protein [Streptomyces sp. NBC_01429]
MGWTVLYIAFGIVALWLLGEVLLQYKARLRWRLLAFAGFVVVVLGVLIPQVFVIAVGAIAFAVGQTYVTLSFRRGFSTGWSIGGSPGASRRRRAVSSAAADREPALEISDLEYEPVAPAADPASVYATEPIPDETGQYGVYDESPAGARSDGPAQDQGRQNQGSGQDADGWGGGFDAYPAYPQYSADQVDQADQDVFASPTRDGYANQDSYAGQGQEAYAGKDAYSTGQDAYGTGYPGQDVYAAQDSYPQQYDYGNAAGEQQYAAYSDPYVGSSHSAPANDGQQYGSYDGFGGGRQQYADPYDGQQYAGDTPPGGVWVPQQRERDENAFPPAPGEQPQQQGYDPNYNDQRYRY